MRRLASLLLLALLLLPLGGASAQERSGIAVYYVGPEDAVYLTLVRSAPALRLVPRPELAQVFVLNDADVEMSSLQTVGGWVRKEEAGLVLFAGPHLPRGSGDLRAVLGVGAVEFAVVSGGPPQKVVPGTEEDPLLEAIAWSSAPPVGARTIAANPNIFRPLLLTEGGEPLVERMRGRDRYHVFIVSPWLDDASNAEWSAWPYFTYLVYRLTAEAGGADSPLPFADYPLAPVPHRQLRLELTLGGVLLLFGAVAIYSAVRRRAFLSPRLLPPPPPAPRWVAVGFHRPLSGAVLLMAGGVVLLFPLWLYASWFLPHEVFPFAQTAALWQRLSLAGWLLAILLDAGVNRAAVWYFARIYPYRPDEAMRYVQFAFWWQWLTGAALLGLMALAAGLFLPYGAWAYLTYPLLFQTVVQFPGFLTLFRYLFRALQRFDAEQVLTLAALAALPLFQGASAFLLRRWGMTVPRVGAEMGAMAGMALGTWLDLVFTFLLGVVLAYTIGFRPRGFLMPTFDREVGWRMVGYGVRVAWGDLVMPLLLLVLLVLLPRWPQVEAEAALTTPLLALTAASLLLREGLFADLMPAVAETATAGYRTLLRYYLSRGVRYGLWMGLFLASVGSALAVPLLRGVLKVELPSAALFALWGALGWTLWWADAALEGTGRPALRSWLRLLEGGVALGGILLAAPRYGLEGIAWALLAAAFVRTVAAFLVVRRAVIAPHLYLWQAVVAPAGAALVLYNLVAGVAELIAPTRIREAAALAILAWATLPLYAFLTAFLGGWEARALDELARALDLLGPLRTGLRPLVAVIRLGRRLSPLKGQYPLHWWALAEEEAAALTLHRPGWRRWP